MAMATPLFAAYKPAVLEAPRHVTLVDDHGVKIQRGQNVTVKSVLGGGGGGHDQAVDAAGHSERNCENDRDEVMYVVSVVEDGPVVSVRAELVVPER